MKAFGRYALATLALIVAIAPVYWLLTISLKREIDQFAYPPRWINLGPTLQNSIQSFRGGWPPGVSNFLVAMAFALLAATVIFSRSLMRVERSR
jgi:ABC-type glycerol-3-phosphate transport system permease component